MEESEVEKKTSLVQLVEDTIKSMGIMPVKRESIETALQYIDAGKVEVMRYSTGEPSLLGVYDLATQLEAADSEKH